MNPAPVVLYDGPCALCQRSVRFILRHERDSRLTFAPLDSEFGKSLQTEHHIPRDLDAMILIDAEGATWGSDAVFRICGHLRAPWRWAHGLRRLPSAPFQAGYRFLARRRAKWFGRTDPCPLPDPEVAERFR